MAQDGEGSSLFYFILFRSEHITYQSSLPMHTNYVWKESPTVSSTLLSSLPDSPLLGSLLFQCHGSSSFVGFWWWESTQRTQSSLVCMGFLCISWIGVSSLSDSAVVNWMFASGMTACRKLTLRWPLPSQWYLFICLWLMCHPHT